MRLKSIVVGLLAVCAAMAVPGVAVAKSGEAGTIIGRVLSMSKTPLVGVCVSAYPASQGPTGTPAASTVTVEEGEGEHGFYELELNPRESYVIEYSGCGKVAVVTSYFKEEDVESPGEHYFRTTSSAEATHIEPSGPVDMPDVYLESAPPPEKTTTGVTPPSHEAMPAPVELKPVVKPGTVVVAGAGQVNGVKATVQAKCVGEGACQGTIKLVYTERKKKVVKKHGKKHVKHVTKNVTVGTGSFSIAANGHETLTIELTGKGGKLVEKAGKHGLRVRLSGSDVKARTLLLREAKKHKGKSRGHHGHGKHHGHKKH